MKRNLIFGYALAALVTLIAGSIEWLNVRAGGRLPNREYYNNDPSNGPVEWRVSAGTTEAGWRQLRGPRDENGRPEERELTPAERQEMLSDIARAKANNNLRLLVSTAGLGQYLLVPALSVSSVLAWRGRRRTQGALFGAVALIAGALMFHRAYVTSMGW